MMPRPPRSTVGKMLRFGLVGVANSLIDLAVFSVLIWAQVAPLPANVAGWALAIAFSYLVNSRWSFERSAQVGEARSAVRFIVLGAAITLGVSSGAIIFLAPHIGVLPAKVVGLIAAAVLNFVAARWSIEDRVV
ncbi:MAG: GtrA family protein [Rhizobiaceae bacterium]|nr:GtrA family protein [Rhizobiaceae bacterium]